MPDTRTVRNRSRLITWIRVSFWLVIALLILAALWATRCGERIPSIYIQTGQAMEPTLAEGEYFVAWSPADRIERGDLVVFRFVRGTREFHVVRRLAALPGDTVAMDSGVVVLNGESQAWPFDIASPRAWRSEFAIEENIYTWGPWVVPPDSAVLLSDRRDMLGWPDSRFIGFIPLDEILARAVFTLRGRRLRSLATTPMPQGVAGPFVLAETTLVIPQVDYEPAIYYREGDPYPHLDLSKVDNDRVVEKEHAAVVLENEYIRLTLLPAMGRVYALHYKPTAHDQLWRNDIVSVGGGVNDTGWWIWIGGVEYTLPGDEHGTTWATPWTWEVVEDSPDRKTVRMAVEELGTRLQETIDISLYPGRAYYEAAIRIFNPTADTVYFAHWVNPQWTPGGRNELTDSTEFIIPTERVLIAEKWQPNMGPSPQDWTGNRYRFIAGWEKMGDLMADGVREGFYSVYSHDEEEGIVRVFDKEKTPGVDVWTYGYHTTRIPMGTGSPNKGYVEMWGGTSKLFPDERRPLPPGASLEWTEWMYPYHGTRGLTHADQELAVSFRLDPEGRAAIVGVCPSGNWEGTLELSTEGQPLGAWTVNLDPEAPFLETIDVSQLNDEAIAGLRLRVGSERTGWRTHVITNS